MRMLDLVGHLLLQTRKLKTKLKWFTQVTRLSSWLNHKENTCLMKAVYPTIPLIFIIHCAFELLAELLKIQISGPQPQRFWFNLSVVRKRHLDLCPSPMLFYSAAKDENYQMISWFTSKSISVNHWLWGYNGNACSLEWIERDLFLIKYVGGVATQMAWL